MGAPVPQIMKDFEDNVRHVPQELVQKWEVEPIVGAPVPQIWEPIVDDFCTSVSGGCRGSCA